MDKTIEVEMKSSHQDLIRESIEKNKKRKVQVLKELSDDSQAIHVIMKHRRCDEPANHDPRWREGKDGTDPRRGTIET